MDERRCTSRSSSRHRTSRYSRHANTACGGIVSRFASMSDYTGRTLSCSRWLRVHTYIYIYTLAGNTLSLPAESRSGVNAISTIQTGHRKVTLQRQRHKNVHRALRIPPCFNGVSILPGSAISDANLHGLPAG